MHLGTLPRGEQDWHGSLQRRHQHKPTTDRYARKMSNLLLWPKLLHSDRVSSPSHLSISPASGSTQTVKRSSEQSKTNSRLKKSSVSSQISCRSPRRLNLSLSPLFHDQKTKRLTV
ncbi:hypothetical protein F2Q68_00006933 [Brassica cretica]|uniref:Uncharacterized protein n=1 Tax=Brassica cretica TaxID=69181 RepID=A0A8S9MWN4_BRACR|nr:hypothetical protein F2Q68_00006933 [Brassica cretica]KAF3485812.1 hypothetical protein F2Q69_00057613 [Brassica cretica]